MGKAASRQNGIGAQAIVADAGGSLRAQQNLSRILQLRQQGKRLAHMHLKMLRGVFVDKLNGLAHAARQHQSARSLLALKASPAKVLTPFGQLSDLTW